MPSVSAGVKRSERSSPSVSLRFSISAASDSSATLLSRYAANSAQQATRACGTAIATPTTKPP